MKKIKIGLTGLGRIGKVHLESLVFRLPEAEVLAVSDPNPDTAAVAESYGVDTFYESYEEVLAHPGIEAVVICSPTGTHKEYIEKAAAAGKHIFCEKPLEMTVAKIQSIEDTVKKHGVKSLLAIKLSLKRLLRSILMQQTLKQAKITTILLLPLKN